MLNTYIKNTGSTQTLIGNNCNRHVEQVDWNAAYDGNKAKVMVNINSDGKENEYHYTLDNGDLANMLNLNSVNIPLHKRLKQDFRKPPMQPLKYKIRLPKLETPPLMPREPNYLREPFSSNYLSSPASNQEFIVPITLDQSSSPYTFAPRRRPTHKTYRAFKRVRSTPSRRRFRSFTRHRNRK